jgi:hypothetical protein
MAKLPLNRRNSHRSRTTICTGTLLLTSGPYTRSLALIGSSAWKKWFLTVFLCRGSALQQAVSLTWDSYRESFVISFSLCSRSPPPLVDLISPAVLPISCLTSSDSVSPPLLSSPAILINDSGLSTGCICSTSADNARSGKSRFNYHQHHLLHGAHRIRLGSVTGVEDGTLSPFLSLL